MNELSELLYRLRNTDPEARKRGNRTRKRCPGRC